VSDVFSNNALKVLKENLRAKMNDVSDHISTGSCKNYDEYSKCCGIIEGLAIAEREILDLNERIENA
jgi:hypothetical protein|tara:strand:- start:1374 stop:1574 length:201 start_codon:yes stop_codon:yes gene_type:complete